MKTAIKKVIEAIETHKKFIISAHINLEGDSLCAQLAMLNLLEGMKKDSHIVDADPVPPHLTFLPKAKRVSNDLGKRIDFDVALILDCPNLQRIGRVQGILRPETFIVNIDHHISNEQFGAVNWVEPEASSAGEMIYQLYKEMGREISQEAALYLYIAIATDTGSFSYDNTGPETHRAVADLLERGVKPGQVSEKVYETRSLADIKLLGRVLATLKVNDSQEVAYLDITKKMLQETGADMSKTDTIVNYARSIDKVKVAVLFREDPKHDHTIAISFRSKGDVDVNKIAKALGGGGHKKASGCMIEGSLEEVRKKVLAIAEESLRKG